MIHTIRDTPPNPSGLLALSTDSSHCYLAYPGIHDNDGDDADDDFDANADDHDHDAHDHVDDDVDDPDHDVYDDIQATLTPESSKCLTASIWPAGWDLFLSFFFFFFSFFSFSF